MVYTESEPTGSEIWDVTKKIVDNMKREDLPDDVTDVTGAGARKEELQGFKSRTDVPVLEMAF